MWICKSCGNNNEDGFDFCSNCGSKRPHEYKAQPDSSWICKKCGCKNDSSYNFCSNCGSNPEPVNKSWTCKSCGKRNDEAYTFCAQCGADRRGPGVQTDPLNPPIPPYVWIGAFIILCLVAVIIVMAMRPPTVIEEPAPVETVIYAPQTPAATPQPTATPAPTATPQPYQPPVVQPNPIRGYNMVVYVTQSAQDPYPRMFRNFSINNALGACGARESYGEKHFELQITPQQLANAKAYGPGEFIPNIGEQYVGGVNVTQETAYVITVGLDNQGRYYPMFIKNEIR